jgi:hypothetical protein
LLTKWPYKTDTFQLYFRRDEGKPKPRALRMSPLFLGIVLTVSFVCLRAMGQAGSTDEKTTVAEHDGQHDFDFIFGRWKVHLKRKAAGANTWTEFDGTSVLPEGLGWPR